METDNEMLDILGECEIMPADDIDLSDNRKFTKLELTQGQRIQMSGLLNQLPAIIGTDILSKTMILKFPKGIQGALVQLKNGGYTTTLRDVTTGRFNGTAWLEHANTQALCLGSFTAISIASGQYFLAQINNSLTQISLGLDKILEFLYGDKRAELLSEVNFIKFSYENYKSVMQHSEQRIATLISLQNAKKVAMKDIEFYLSDLSCIVTDKKSGDIPSTVSKMLRTKECLDLSLQLYTMSNLLEVYYSENYDSHYISFVKSEASEYIGKCEKRSLYNFGQLQHLLTNTKDGIFTKINKTDYIQQINAIVGDLEVINISPLLVTLQSALDEIINEKQYCLSKDGDVYLKIG